MGMLNPPLCHSFGLGKVFKNAVSLEVTFKTNVFFKKVTSGVTGKYKLKCGSDGNITKLGSGGFSPSNKWRRGK